MSREAPDPAISASLHHAHLFASDLEASLAFYRDMFGAEVVLDTRIAGSRNVLIRIGDAYLNFYDQPPPAPSGRSAVHHLGIRTKNLADLVAHMKRCGFEFRQGIQEFHAKGDTDVGAGRYVMAMAPDGVLLEIFETEEF